MFNFAKKPAVFSSESFDVRVLGFFIITSVFPVLPSVKPSARIFPVCSSLTITFAPPIEVPINLASLAFTLIITEVS